MLSAKFSVNRSTLITLERAVLKGLAATFQRIMERSVEELKPKLFRTVEEAIRNSPEAQSLLHGSLHGQLGVKDPEAALIRVIELVNQSTKAFVNRVRVRGGSLVGGMTIYVLKLDFALLLRAAAVKFESEGGSKIKWLEWLLERGTEPVVFNYDFVPLNHATSRTGEGFMRYTPGVNWHVPAEFAGTHDNNWLTRAITPLGPEIANLVKDTFLKQLRNQG